MRNARKLTLAAGASIAALAATGLAAQDQSAPAPHAPTMGQGMVPMMGMTQQTSRIMETCNATMQADTAQPQQPQKKQ